MEDEFKIDIKVKKGLYRHYKGDEYIVWGQGFHTETGEPLVFYMSIRDGKSWARPASMFIETVKMEGKSIPRFQLLKSYEV